MNAIRRATSLVFAGVSAIAAAGELSITEPTVMTHSGDYDNAVISAELTIASGAKVIAVGKSTKIDAVVTLREGAKFSTSSSSRQYSHVELGANGGCGGFAVEAGGRYGYDDSQLALWIEALALSSAAVTEGECIDVLTLGNGAYADITCFTNENAKSARYVFDGGFLRNSYKNSVGSPLNADEGKSIIFKGVNGNPIKVLSVYNRPTYFFLGEGAFRTEGECDFVIEGMGERDAVPSRYCTARDQNPYPSTATNNPNRSWFRITPNGIWEWAHAGDTRLQGYAWLRLSADNRLPSGSHTGGIKLEPSARGIPRLDMNGYSSEINSLVAGEGTQVTNFATAVTSTLTFGMHKDGVLSAVISGNIDIVKRNAATRLTVSDTTLPQSFTVVEGTVTVVAGEKGVSQFSGLTLEAGSVLEIDGAEVGYTHLENNGGSVVCRNGGRLVYRKVGPDTFYHIDATEVMDVGGVHVKEGALVFSGDTSTNEWWRFRFRAAETTSSKLEIGRIALSSAINDMVTGQECLYNSSLLNCKLMSCDTPEIVAECEGYTNYVYRSEKATHPKDMPRGTALLSPGRKFMYRHPSSGMIQGMLDDLFDLDTSYRYIVYWTEMLFEDLKLDEYNPNTWVDVTFRLTEGKNTARAYTFYATKWAQAMARSWIVETSPDGMTWEKVDERSETPLKTYYTDPGKSYAWYRFPHGYRFTSGHLTGALGFSVDATVRVDAGAILDCTMVVDRQTVKSLAVDAFVGCGMFKGVSFAETGTINVVNWSRAVLKEGVSFEVEDSAGMENIAGWSVLKNGEPVDASLYYENGRLLLKPRAFVFTVR